MLMGERAEPCFAGCILPRTASRPRSSAVASEEGVFAALLSNRQSSRRRVLGSGRFPCRQLVVPQLSSLRPVQLAFLSLRRRSV